MYPELIFIIKTLACLFELSPNGFKILPSENDISILQFFQSTEKNVGILIIQTQLRMTERLQDAHLSPRFLYLFLRRRRILCARVATCNFP